MNLRRPEGMELGLGTIGLGRPWPVPEILVPPMEDVSRLLTTAIDVGIRLIDTAPAYGLSEMRLGRVVRQLPHAVRDRLIICTKIGESWSAEHGSTVDHSLEARCISVDHSLELLGRIDLLQIHKCTVDVLRDEELVSWLVDLRASGAVGAIGASISDAAALAMLLDFGVFDAVQFPANWERPELLAMFTEHPASIVPLLNRPFGSGSITPGPEALAWLRERLHQGYVLSGTTSPHHLLQNLEWMEAT